MPRQHYSDLLALAAVAQERSFTRAAVQLGVSQSLLSHTIRELEARLGVRLLTRTTRSVSLTEAGETLLNVVSPRLKDIEAELRAIAEMRDEPAGTIRIAATDHAVDTVLWPKLAKVLAAHSRINVEIHADQAPGSVLQGHHEFGVRLGNELAKDISAIRIGPDLRFVIVAAPAYLASRPPPSTPADLVDHECINLRLPQHGSAPVWELKRGQRAMSVRVKGRLAFNGIYQVVNAALSGFGLAYIPEDLARPHLERGSLAPVLKSWWSRFPGYHLFYASQRESSPAMRVVINALRYGRPGPRPD